MSDLRAMLGVMLKVLVSTLETQGSVPGDFSYVPAGELVGRYSLVCDSERADGSGCGCGRAFGGFTTHRSTTTAMVVERDMTEADWRKALYDTLVSTGWAGMFDDTDALAGLVDELVAHDLHYIADIPAGTVLGRRAYNEGRGDAAETVDTLLDRTRLRPFI